MLKLGYANLYVTRMGKCILIEKPNGEKYVISPESPEAFLEYSKATLSLEGNIICGSADKIVFTYQSFCPTTNSQ